MKLTALAYGGALGLVSAETLYGYYWAIPNIGVRLGIWPADIHPELFEIIPTLSWGQEAIFFTHVGLNTLALIALLYRWSVCLWLFLISFLLDRLDWILLGMNPLSSVRNEAGLDWVALISNFGGIGLTGIMQLVAIALMALLAQRQYLERGMPDALSGLINRLRSP